MSYLFPLGANPFEIKPHLLLVEVLLGCTFAPSCGHIFVDKLVVVTVPRLYFLRANRAGTTMDAKRK